MKPPTISDLIWLVLSMAISIIVPSSLRGETPKRDSIEVGVQRQLFLDDYLVASTTNISRRIHQAEKSKSNPVIRQTESWEDPFNILYGSVIRDGEKYKAWYKSGPGVSYAESDDGIHWVKPALDLVTIRGAKTNILFRKISETKGSDELSYYHELFGVHRDERDPDPSRRYKMGFLSIDWEYKGPREGRFRAGQRRGLGIAGSPDGIHWKLIDSFATEGICDGATHWMFDPALGKYVLYGRTLKTPPEIEAAWSKYDWYKHWYSGRAVGRLESSDFVKWNFTAPFSSPVVMTADLKDKPGTEIYSLLVFPYESVYLGLVQTFHALPDDPALDVQLAVSRDGINFSRVEDRAPGESPPTSRSPFITNGPVGSWDRFNQSLASNPPITVGDELRFYYGGRTYRHAPYEGKDTGPRAGCIGLATIQRDRFVSLDASFDGGEIITKPLKLKGKTLHLNANSEFGEISVEALDLAGKSITKAKPIRRDSLDSPVEWEAGVVTGDVVLRITLKNACLFALWCDKPTWMDCSLEENRIPLAAHLLVFVGPGCRSDAGDRCLAGQSSRRRWHCRPGEQPYSSLADPRRTNQADHQCHQANAHDLLAGQRQEYGNGNADLPRGRVSRSVLGARR